MTRKKAAPQPHTKTAGRAADQIPAGRRWLFRLVSLVVIPVLLLAGVEVGLRLVGYGYSTSFFRKFTIGGRACLVDNDQFGLRFFPPTLARFPAPVVMEARKAPGTFRIFIFGESAALGDPRPNFGAGRYLEALLRERYPEGRFEIVNTGVTAINSHVILPIARECAELEGDCWLIFMGNNEMVGPFGAATVFGRQAPALSFVRLSLAAQKTRIGQFLVQVSRRLRGGGAESSWHGMEMFVQNKVPPGDPRKETVYRNFQANLDDILRAARGTGAKVILNTVAVNLADCAPFASLSSEDLVPAQRSACDQVCNEALQAVSRRDWAAAAQGYERAVTSAPASAELHFRLGECLREMTNKAAASEQFRLSADKDLLPFRTDSRLNKIIHDAAERAQGDGVRLCDSTALMGTNNPAGVPGHESFFEHVHLNFTGNYRLGLLWANEVAKLLPPGFTHTARAVWATQKRCEELIGLSDWNRLSTVEEVLGRLKQPPFTGQPDNDRRLAELAAWAKDLKHQIATNSTVETRKLYEEALRRSPEDYGLHQNFAEFLEAVSQPAEALREMRKVCELIPHYYFPYYQLGCALKRQGQIAEAKENLLKAAELNPRSGEVCLELGMVYGRSTEWELALRQFERARQFSQEDPHVPLYAGEVLRKLNRRGEATESFRAALRLEPNYWEAHFRLGEELAVQRQFPEAVQEFRHTLRINPQYARAYVTLAAALFELGQVGEAERQLDEALRIDPRNNEALTLRQRLRGPTPPLN